MSSLASSLSVTVNTKRRACVLNIDLAVSRYGLLLSQRLSEEFDLWLVRAMWRWLDNIEIPERPALEGDKKLLSESKNFSNYEQWEIARIATDQAGLKFFWLGDALRESLLPPGVDHDLLYRYELLGNSLDLRIEKDELCNSTHGAFRDAAALTVALIPYQGFILTLLNDGEGILKTEPAICTYLRKWGIDCYNVDTNRITRFERTWFSSIFSRTHISELLWAGLKLAVVYLFVPKAIIFPSMKREEEYFEGIPTVEDHKEYAERVRFDSAGEISDTSVLKIISEEKDWWEDAMCFWHTLGP